MSKRKYRPVKRICSVSDFEKSKAIWYQNTSSNKTRMWHRSALESLQYHTLKIFINKGCIFECERIKEEGD